MKKIKLFVVMNEGEVAGVFESKRDAERFAEDKWDKAVREVLEERGYDPDDVEPEIWARAEYQAGYEGGIFEVYKVEFDADDDDIESIELPNGDTVYIADLL